jgi:hypothetical protein
VETPLGRHRYDESLGDPIFVDALQWVHEAAGGYAPPVELEARPLLRRA